jgi:DNA-binding GntR family transcriptional regulator
MIFDLALQGPIGAVDWAAVGRPWPPIPGEGVAPVVLRTTPLIIKSAEDQVYEVLRDEIVHVMEPGSPLPLARIAERLGVSTMPVRAALMRLEADGLVHQVPRRGAIVAPLELDDLQEIQAIRAGIEGLAARLGARRVDDRTLGRMEALLGVLRSAAGRHDLDQYLRIAGEFEDECYRAAGRPRLLHLVQGHRQAAQRYVRLALGDSPDFEVAFHERLYGAAAAHDGPAAEATIRAALAWTLDRLAHRLRSATADRPPASPADPLPATHLHA